MPRPLREVCCPGRYKRDEYGNLSALLQGGCRFCVLKIREERSDGLLARNRYDKKYLHVALPAAMEGVFMILLSNVDLILVGTLGTAAIAAVSIFTQPRMMILTLARSLAAALTLLAAECYGRGDHRKASSLLSRSLLVWGSVLVVVHILFYRHLEGILLWMGAEESYLPLALSYARIVLPAVFLTSLAAVLQAVMLGFGETGKVLSVNVQGNVVNLAVSALLIFGPGPFPAMGVRGAAIGTVAGTVWTMAVTLIFLWRERMFQGSGLSLRGYFREFLPVFGSVFSEQGFERIGMVLYTRMAAELGTIPYAVHAICMNFCDFYYSFAGGLGKASMVLAGQSMGKRDSRRWERYLRCGIRWGVIFSLGSFLLTFLFREEIFSLYSGDGGAMELGSVILIFVAAVSFPEAHAMIAAGVLRGSGKALQVAAYSFVSITLLRPLVTAFFLYVLEMGLVGAWLALAIDQSIRAACAHFLLRRLQKKITLKGAWVAT